MDKRLKQRFSKRYITFDLNLGQTFLQNVE